MQRNSKNSIYLFVLTFFHFLTSIKSDNSTVLDSEYPWLRLPPTPQLPYPHDGKYAPINNISIWYTTYGPNNGVPILFVHGGLASSDYWGAQVQQLQSTYKCILMDSRAQGRSPSSSANISIDLMTSDVVSLLDYLGLSKVHVVGWSDGANIAVNLAMNYPNRLYSVFAFGGNYKPSEGGGGAVPPLFVAFMKRAQAEYEAFNPGKPYDILLNDILTLWRTDPNWTKVNFEKIPSNIPIWIVGADHEEAVPREQTDTMASWIPQAGELILPRTSHFALLQDPHKFTAAIEQFLAEATNATTCSNYRYVCGNSCSGISSNLFYTLTLAIAFRLMFGHAG